MEKFAIVIAGPSGAGKTTVADRLILSLGTLEMSRSATTRERRGDGRDDEYIYLSRDEFLSSVNNGDMLEYTDYGGNFYGTRKCELERIWDMDKNPILVLDYNGAKSLKERLGMPVYAFYVYTSLAEAENRLRRRDLVSEPSPKKLETLCRRIKENISDFSKLHLMSDLFDVYIENSDLEECVSKISEYISELSLGREVMSADEKKAITEKFRLEAGHVSTV